MDAAELARRFDLGAGARLSDGPVARGKQGAVWRLETDQGRWAVKVPFQPTTEDDVRVATRFQEAAYVAGVPTPRVRRTIEGRVFTVADGRPARVYEWVDLLPPDSGLDPALVGAVVAAIHQVPVAGRADPDGIHPGPAAGPGDAGDPGEVHGWHRNPVGAVRWDRLVEELTAAGAPFAGRLADLRDELVALESWLESPQNLRTCHCDLWADNVLPTADGGLCVIDWENSGPADPSQELGYVVFEFARSDPGRVRALIGAYRAAGGPGALTRPGHFSMLIAQLGHITELAATDWLQPTPRSPDRAAAQEWISEVFDEPHTRAVLGELLRAASAR